MTKNYTHLEVTQALTRAFLNSFEEVHGGDESQREHTKALAGLLLEREDANKHDLHEASCVLAQW